MMWMVARRVVERNEALLERQCELAFSFLTSKS